MSKINPLQRIVGIPDEQKNGKQKPNRASYAGETFGLDRVEISSKARLVQRAEILRKSSMDGLMEDARRLGNHWYLYGYRLPEADGLE